MSLSIKKNNVAQVFSDKVIDFTNEQSGDFVKNTFVDDGLIQLLRNRFDRDTYWTDSGGNFVKSLVF